MPLSTYFRRVLMVLIATIGVVAFMTMVMTFFGVSPTAYNPYMYFMVGLGVLAIVLSPQPLSIID